MKLYMELILSVSLTGTIPFCIYLLLKKWLDTKIRATFQYMLLKLLLLCFIFPFSLLKSLLLSSITRRSSLIFDEYVYLDNKIVQAADGYHLHPQGGFYKVLLPLWFTSLVVILCYQFYRYLSFRHKVLRQLEPDHMHQKEFSVQKAQCGLKRSVALLYCDAAISPFTYGIFHPCVVITSAVPEEAVSMTIRHELQHVRSHDFLFQTAAFLVVLLHCWNPFIYLLWKEIREIQEMACDEKITKSLSPSEVRLYGYSIVDITTSIQWWPSFVTRLAQNNKKGFYRRITRLSMRFNKKSILFSTFLFVSCLIGFCIPALACSPEILYFNADSNEDLSSINWIYMELADDNTPACPEDEFHFQDTSQYILLENGTILDYSAENTSYRQKAACVHSWQKATLKKHLYDGRGGCTVFIYSATVCVKCTTVKNQTLINENHYIVCPH